MNKEILKYHPLRYAKHMKPVIKKVVEDYYGHNQDDEKEMGGLLAGVIFEEVAKHLIETFPHDPMPSDPSDWAEYKEEAFGFFERYMSTGENIFHVQPALAEMFKKTDVDEVVINQLRVPFETFYLYFGDSPQLKVGEKLIDGAYITADTEEESSVMLCFTTSDPSLNYAAEMHPSAYMVSDIHLYYVLATDPRGTVGEAIQASLKEFGEFDHLRERFYEWRQSFPDATRLVMNSLCYLGSPHKEVRERFTDETPKTLVKKYKSSITEKQKKRTLSKAQVQGFRVIKFLGDSIQQTVSATYSGGSVSPHWRRGHWRNQACGPERKEHKLIWIQPTIVKKDLGEPLKARHLYEVEEKNG